MCETEKKTKITMSNGIFLTLKGGDDFYLVQGAKRHHLPYSAWKSLFDREDKIRIKSKAELESIPLGAPMSEDTCLIKGDRTDPVYLYSNGTKSFIRNPHDFELAGFSWGKIKSWEQSDVDRIRTVRDFVIESQKEITIDSSELPSDFRAYPKYGILKSIKYPGDEKERGCILLPESKSNEKLPVLYLLHGMGTNEEWENDNAGQIQHIMGYMVNKKMISDMVIVMPYIMSSNFDCEEKKVHDFHYFNKELVHLMDYVNDTYSEIISTCKEDTAINGISIGGTTALYNGCLYKDRFGHVGGISSNYHLIKCHDRQVHDGWLDKEGDFVLGTDENGFAYIAIGKNDASYLIHHNKYYSNVLNANGINHVFGYLPNGGHNWEVFRKLFYHFMSYDFFRKK